MRYTPFQRRIDISISFFYLQINSEHLKQVTYLYSLCQCCSEWLSHLKSAQILYLTFYGSLFCIMKQYVNKRQGMLMTFCAIFKYYLGFYETNSFSIKFFYASISCIVHPMISFGHLVLNFHGWCKVQSCTYVKYNNSH